MKIEDFIKDMLKQIHSACAQDDAYMPREIEFSIQVNIKGEVCKPDDICVSTIRVKV